MMVVIVLLPGSVCFGQYASGREGFSGKFSEMAHQCMWESGRNGWMTTVFEMSRPSRGRGGGLNCT